MAGVVQVGVVGMLDDEGETVAFDEESGGVHLRTEENPVIPLAFILGEKNPGTQPEGVAVVASLQKTGTQRQGCKNQDFYYCIQYMFHDCKDTTFFLFFIFYV